MPQAALRRYRREFAPRHFSPTDRAWYLNRDGSPKFDAFSHSAGCDKLLETLIESAHVHCACACHGLRLRLDLNAAPGYVREAAQAQAYQAENVDAVIGVPFSQLPMNTLTAEQWNGIRKAENAPEYLNFLEQPDDPICELCDDPMSVCECVE